MIIYKFKVNKKCFLRNFVCYQFQHTVEPAKFPPYVHAGGPTANSWLATAVFSGGSRSTNQRSATANTRRQPAHQRPGTAKRRAVGVWRIYPAAGDAAAILYQGDLQERFPETVAVQRETVQCHRQAHEE